MKKSFVIIFVVLFIFLSCENEETPPVGNDIDNRTDEDSVSTDADNSAGVDEREDIDNEIPDERNDSNNPDETVDADNTEEPDETVDIDEAEACVSGTTESKDCDISGKQLRKCEDGSWGKYSECIDITAKIKGIATNSACVDYSWADRGKAPLGYIQGIGLIFASALCNTTRSDVLVASQAKTADLEHDALAWYDDSNIFSNLGMSNDLAGITTLRHAYTLMIGLGMRESSGQHCVGRDTSATNTTADTAEAGLFQTSYNSRVFSDELPILFTNWKATKQNTPEKCLLETFSENVTCNATNWENYGTGDGRDFQELEKTCPAFAAEYVAVMLRVSGGSKGHYGPLRRHDAEVRTECDNMLLEIQQAIEVEPAFCEFLVNN